MQGIKRQLRLAVRACAAGFAMGAGFAPAMFGAPVDRTHFRVDGIAIVWAADDAGNAPIVSSFIVQNGASNADLIPIDTRTVVTGTLDPIDTSFPEGAGAALRIENIPGSGNQNTTQGDRLTSASDVLTPFALDSATDVRTIRSDILTSFYVATNKPFHIDVVASSTNPADLNLIRLRMLMTLSGNDDGLSFGSAAQYPHSGNTNSSGVQWTGFRALSNLTVNQDIFRGDRRTAVSGGSIADQSVRFDLDYRWSTGNIDLSDGTFDVAADVIYTVYIP